MAGLLSKTDFFIAEKLDKVRAKRPQNDKFTALLRPDESAQLQLYYDTVESNLDDYFFVLRLLGKEGDVPQREIAKHLKRIT